jgi:NAD(P)-dependent dehydrogenase (short-subunit alcohol dehydrogenase family)
VVDYTVEEWERMLHVNTTSCFLAIKYAAPAMQITNTEKRKDDAGGSIIMTASGALFIFTRIAPIVLAMILWD